MVCEWRWERKTLHHARKEERIKILTDHKVQIEEELKRLALLYAKQDMPEYLLDQLIGDQNTKLELVKAELAKLTQHLETPLTDKVITGIVEFSYAFHEHLEAVQQTYTGRLTVIEGLEVTAEVLLKDGKVHLRMKSILQPEGVLQTLSKSP